MKMNLKKNLLFNWSKPLRSRSKRIFIALFLSIGGAYGSGIYADIHSGELLIVDQVSRQITGQVVDVLGDPLIGVNVVVVGAETIGTITNMDGAFSLHLPEGKTQVKVSYIGYQDQVITIGGSSHINVTLLENSELLSEVVVVGYGTQKKVNLTGSVSTVGQDVFEDRGVVSNPLQALQGEVAGMTVTRTSSAPGREDWKFQVRGASSVNESNALVLIDGVPGSMDNLNPDDIENISILKDGAAAIYGARAAGGVVLITTKRGKNQKATVTYKANVEFKRPGLIMDYMGMQNYMYTYEEAYLNSGTSIDADLNIYPRFVVDAYKTMDPQYLNSYVEYMNGDIHDYGFYDVNWSDVLWGTAVSQSHGIGIQGGSERYLYNLSVGYMKDGSLLKSEWGKDNSKRYNIRLNNDYKLTDKINLFANLSFERRETIYPQRKPNDVGGQPAGSPVATEDGLPYAWGGQYGSHWFSKLGGEYHTTSNSFSANFGTDIEIIKDLKLTANASFRTFDRGEVWWENMIDWYYLNGDFNQTNPTTDKMGRKSRSTLYQNYTGFLEYKKNFGYHGIGVTGGLSYESETYTDTEITAYDLLTETIHSLKTYGSLTASDNVQEWGLASVFGRINYNFRERYLFEAVGRYDGSSKFTRDNRWKPFFGASAAWRLSEESFMRTISFIDNFKIRLSYGELGNQSGINNYDYIALLDINSSGGNKPGQPIFGPDSGPAVSQTITQKNMVSLSRTWEKISTQNIGIDIAVLDSRLSFSADYFIKNNNNMLVSVTYPSVLGTEAPKTNSGKLKTKGWELSLNWKDKIGDVTYYVGANLSDNWNKLVRMDNAVAPTLGFQNFVEGYPIYSYFGYEAHKLIETEEELVAYKAIEQISGTNLRVGDMMYRDLDGDGYITSKDIKYLGDRNPRMVFGFNLGASWKGFDVSAYFQGVGRSTIFRESGLRGPMTVWYQRQNDSWYGKWWSDIAEKYPEANLLPVNKDPNALPKLSSETAINDYNYAYSDGWYRKMNGKYVRMKTLVIGYTIPKHMLSKAKINNLRVYFSGNDLFEFQKIKDGWDPEASYDITGGTIGSNMYPFSRTYSFGIDLTF